MVIQGLKTMGLKVPLPYKLHQNRGVMQDVASIVEQRSKVRQCNSVEMYGFAF